jgi:preprotein translocase subunit YajC
MSVPPEQNREQQKRPNPYVGPRAFVRGEQLYGRDSEVRRLNNLLIAERIVLLHSPSGAGKTSLLQSALIPYLESEGFYVLPTMRVSIASFLPSSGQSAMPPFNRFLLSLLLSLEEALPPEQQMSPEKLAGISLRDYLDTFPQRQQQQQKHAQEHQQQAIPSDDMDDRGKPKESYKQVLIFDQFEEILAIDPTDTEARQVFFEQVGEALSDRSRWVLFVMREDFTAALDPYLRPVPTRMNTRFRLDLLDTSAARQAIYEPAHEVGVEFREAAVTKLVDDLRRVRVQGPRGEMLVQHGTHIEPVQLQVVCYSLWEKLPPDISLIKEEDLEVVGDVDDALAVYYANHVATIANQAGFSERAIRDWFEHHLITQQGIRNQIVQGPIESAGLPNEIIAQLIDARLVRAEKRRGVVWFELAHDRLIEPVKKDNEAWREAHLSLLQRQAAMWVDQNRPDGLLLSGHALHEAEQWARQHEADVTPYEREFLKECQEARARAERERRRNQIILVLAIVAIIAFLVAIVFFFVARWERDRANQARQELIQLQQSLTAVSGQAAMVEEIASQTAAAAAGYRTAAVETMAVVETLVSSENLPRDQQQTIIAQAQQTSIAAQAAEDEAWEQSRYAWETASVVRQQLDSEIDMQSTELAQTSPPYPPPYPAPETSPGLSPPAYPPPGSTPPEPPTVLTTFDERQTAIAEIVYREATVEARETRVAATVIRIQAMFSSTSTPTPARTVTPRPTMPPYPNPYRATPRPTPTPEPAATVTPTPYSYPAPEGEGDRVPSPLP